MKKYLTIAAIAGAIAVISASFIAQAAPETSTVTTIIEKSSETTATAPAIDAAAAPAVEAAASAAAEQAAKDNAECSALASAPKNDGTPVSDAEKADILAKCLSEKAPQDATPAVEGAVETETKTETSTEVKTETKTEAHH